MKNLLLAGVFGVAFTGAVLSQFSTAYASATGDVEMCAAALDAQGVASASDYRAKFVHSKGAAVKTVTVKLVPIADGANATEAECKIQHGQVVEATLKS